MMEIAKSGKIKKVVVYRENGGWIPSFEIKHSNGETVKHALRRQVADEPRVWKRADTVLLWIATNFDVYDVEVNMEGLKYEPEQHCNDS